MDKYVTVDREELVILDRGIAGTKAKGPQHNAFRGHREGQWVWSSI